jgi:putative aldouronate transport system permease protein
MNRRNLSIGDKAFDVGIYIISGLIALLCLYPLYLVLINSFSDPFAVAKGEVVIIPKGFSFDAYKEAFKNGDIVRGYANSLFYLFFGVIINMVMTIPAAYALSKQHMKGRNAIMMMIVFTMYFSGGLIPHYLMVRDLGLINTRAVVLLEGAVTTTNLIIART